MVKDDFEPDNLEITKLTPVEESNFLSWIKNNNITDLDNPDSHYDYRGFWKENPNYKHSSGEHFTDKFKQHGHPTFSIESKYSKSSNDGGHWVGNKLLDSNNKLLVDESTDNNDFEPDDFEADKPKIEGESRSLFEHVFMAPKAITDIGSSISEYLGHPGINDSPLWAQLKGFLGGALGGVPTNHNEPSGILENIQKFNSPGGLSGQLSPANIASMGLPFLREAAPVIPLINKGLGALQIAHGVSNLGKGNYGQGAIDLGMGALGFHNPHSELSSLPAVEEVLPALKEPLQLGPAPSHIERPPTFLAGEQGIVHNVPHAIKTGEVVPPEIPANYGPNVGVGNPGEPLPTLLNLDELKESQRLGDLSYTDTQQYPGTRMDIKNEKLPPLESGDTSLGFSEQTNPDKSIGYPLDIVPNRLRPRAAQNEIADKLGSLIEPEVKRKATTTIIDSDVANPEPVVSYIFGPLKSTPVEKGIAEGVIKSKEPILAEVVKSPEFQEKFIEPAKTRDTDFKKVAANVGSSIDTELTKQSPLLGELAKKVQTDSAIQAGTWTVKYDKIVNDLSDENFSKLVKAIEGKIQLDPVEDARLVTRLEQFKSLNKEVSDSAVQSGMGLKSSDGTKMIPWQPAENYWPHLYTDEFFNLLKNNPTEIRDMLAKQGMSPLEIDALLTNSKKFGERLISAQHGREANLPGYRVDRNVYREHLDSMARRIKESIHYGPMDLADTTSPLMNLVKESNNPEYTENLMKKLLNRDVKGDSSFENFSRQLMGIQAWMHLGTAGISNINTVAMPLIQTNTKAFLRGIADLAMDYSKTGEFAESAGAIRNIFKEIFAQEAKGSRFNPTRLYGLDTEERFMRTLSASTGRAYAKQLFSELKNNPANEKAATTLRNLVLEDPKGLLNQPELNDLQLKRAAFRVSELSQGLAERQNLPAAWKGSGVANLLTLFHRYQFAQTKIMKDLVMSQPMRAIPLLFGMSQIMGEITGDAKAVLRGGIKAAYSGDSSRIEEEVTNRQAWLAKKFGLDPDSVAARMAENAAQSFALGTYADAIEMLGGSGTDAAINMGGSTLGDAIKLFDMIRNTGKGTLKELQGEDAPELGKAATGALSLVPIVGPPISSEIRMNP